MKVYLQGFLFSAVVLCAYLFIDMRVFQLDHLRMVRSALFNYFKPSFNYNSSISLFNTGTLPDEVIIEKVKVILEGSPKAVGIIACDQKSYKVLSGAFSENRKVIVAGCEDGNTIHSARILYEGNVVTHFEGSANSFENRLVGTNALANRGNEIEMIQYEPNAFFKNELTDVESPVDLYGQIVLLGYMGDQITQNEMYYFNNARITPLNPHFGEMYLTPESYDVEISAHIAATIQDNEFIDEVPLWLRILIILGISLLNGCAMMFIRTRWFLVNVVIYLFILLFFIVISGMAILFLFHNHIYLNLDGLEILLLIVSVFTVFSNETKRKKEAAVLN